MTELIATITPKYIDPPKVGKSGKMGPGHVKDQNDVRFDVWTRTVPLDHFTIGVPVQVAFEEKQNGQYTNREIKRVVESQSRPLAQPPKAMAQQPRARANPADSEQIFTLALMKAMIEAGRQYNTTDLIGMVNACRDVYSNTFGSPAKQQSQAEFNDEIPY